MIKLNRTGDTIVEVLIAIAIVGSVLAGAFAASTRSQKSSQQAQEHTTALKIAEGQVELLNSASSQAGSLIYTTNHVFCMNSLDGSVVVDNIKSGSVVNIGSFPLILNNSTDNSLNYGSCVNTNGLDYHIAIDRALASGTTDQFIFTVHIRWDGVQGDGHDEVTLAYKADTP